MYDVDGNGSIDLQEMTKIVKSIFGMIGPEQVSLASSVLTTARLDSSARWSLMVTAQRFGPSPSSGEWTSTRMEKLQGRSCL